MYSIVVKLYTRLCISVRYLTNRYRVFYVGTSDPPQVFTNQLEMDRRERQEVGALIADGRVDQSGTMRDDEKAPPYLAH